MRSNAAISRTIRCDERWDSAVGRIGQCDICALIPEADTVAGIMEVMTIGKFRHLPVVEESKVVGIISIGDIVKWRVREFETEQEALRDYIKTA